MLAAFACGGRQQDSRSCPFTGSIKAADGRAGVPCQVEMALRMGEQWLPVNTLSASTGAKFEGSLGAVTTGSAGMQLRFVAKCEGYAEASREHQWALAPGQCKDLDAGELLVSAVRK